MGYFLIPDDAFSKIVASLTINLRTQFGRDELVEFVSQSIEISDQEKKDVMQGRGNYHLEKAVVAFKEFDEAVAKTASKSSNGLSMSPAAVRQRELRAKKSAKTRAKKGVASITADPPFSPSAGLSVQQI